MEQHGLKRNIPLYYLFQASRASLFFVAIWVVYQETYLSFEQIAFFGAFSWLVLILFELPTGIIGDLISRRISMSIGSALVGFAFLALLWPSYEIMFAYSILFGVGVSMISGSNSALLYDTLKQLNREDDYPRIAANTSLIFQTTAVVAILVGGYLYEFNIKIPYLLRGIVSIVGVIFPLLMIEPKIDTYKFSLKGYVKQTTQGIKEAFKSSYLSRLSLLFVLVGGFAMSNHRFFAQKFLVEINLDTVTRSWLSSGIKLTVGLLTLYLARNKKVFNSKYFILILPVLFVVTLIPVQFLSYPAVVIMIFGIAIPSGSFQIFIGYPLNKRFSSRYRATALSTLNLLASLVYVIAVYFGGVFAEANSVSSYYFLIGVASLVIVVPLALSLVLRRETRANS
ncbi:MAG: MFS transporter [Candidatus Dojkabacteria bacterium]